MCPFILALGFRKHSAEVQVRKDTSDPCKWLERQQLDAVDHRAEPWKTYIHVWNILLVIRYRGLVAITLIDFLRKY